MPLTHTLHPFTDLPHPGCKVCVCMCVHVVCRRAAAPTCGWLVPAAVVVDVFVGVVAVAWVVCPSVLRYITDKVAPEIREEQRQVFHSLGLFARLRDICEQHFTMSPALLRWGFAVLLRSACFSVAVCCCCCAPAHVGARSRARNCW